MASSRQVWRLIQHAEPQDPYYNMGLDEALLLNQDAPPTLRFYQWSPPCLSLGYFQPHTDFDLEEYRNKGWAVTRRITGGGAIAHHHELTFSISCNDKNPAIHSDLPKSYRQLHSPIIKTFAAMGFDIDHRHPCTTNTTQETSACQDEPLKSKKHRDKHPFCFARKADFDLVFLGKKIGGSAQRRSHGRFLQHGSLILAPSGLDDHATSIQDSKQPFDLQLFINKLITAYEETLNIQLSPGDITPTEHQQAQTLAQTKFSTKTWITRK